VVVKIQVCAKFSHKLRVAASELSR